MTRYFEAVVKPYGMTIVIPQIILKISSLLASLKNHVIIKYIPKQCICKVVVICARFPVMLDYTLFLDFSSVGSISSGQSSNKIYRMNRFSKGSAFWCLKISLANMESTSQAKLETQNLLELRHTRYKSFRRALGVTIGRMSVHY